MSHRQSLPFSGRLLTAIVAAIAVAGIADCAPYSAGTRDGSLDGTIVAHTSFARPTVTLNEVMSGAAGTYIDRLLADRDSTIERWPDHVAAPLAVWIDTASRLSGPLTQYPAIVRSAFQQWASTGIPLRFRYVDSPNDADIRVRWTDFLSHKTGSTTWRTDRAGLLTAGDVVLATHISDGHELDARGMRAIALHEVGHALGLSHSLDGRDIMAPLVRVDGLSAADRGTIRLLYSLTPGHVR